MTTTTLTPAAATAAAEDVVTVTEFRRLFRVGRTTVYDRIAAGDIPHVRVGRAVRIPAAYVRTLLAGVHTGDPR